MRELAVRLAASHAMTAYMTDWITDRRPTEVDGDRDGDVRLRSSRNGEDYVYVPWEFVAEGAPWTHSPGWLTKPPASESAKPALALGQTWRTREGKVVTITRDDGSKTPFLADHIWYKADGKANIHHQHPELELVELISEVAPRRIVAISRTVHSYVHTIDAVAEDGTAWWMIVGPDEDDQPTWQQLTPLPPIEERH